MRNNSIKLVGSCILTSVVLGFVCFLSNSKSSMILSENIEALSTDYEWIMNSDGTSYRALEMGERPSKEFLRDNPDYSYQIAPTDTHAYNTRFFYNLYSKDWEELHLCWIPSKGYIYTILNGEYCYSHFSSTGNELPDY